MLELLFLSHFIADFPLQTNSIYAAKMRSVWGVLIHVSVVTLVNIILLLPFITHPNTWYAIALIFVIHMVMDQTKVSVTKKYPGTDNTWFFLIDQAVHILTIIAAVKIFGLDRMFDALTENGKLPFWLGWYEDPFLLLVLSGIIVVSFFAGIILYFITHKRQKIKIIFQYNYPQMFVRVALFVIVMLLGYLMLKIFAGQLALLYIPAILVLAGLLYLVITQGRRLTQNDNLFSEINYRFNIYFPLITGIALLFVLQFIYRYV